MKLWKEEVENQERGGERGKVRSVEIRGAVTKRKRGKYKRKMRRKEKWRV